MKEKEIKLLWGKSGGRCAFEGCRIELSKENIVLGEQAHIIARCEVGPRGDNGLDAKAREKYENLILLCSHHHTLIDKNPDKYPVERLLEMKEKHERWVSDQLSSGVAWEVKLAQVQYLNIPRLSILFAIKGYPVSPDLDIEVNCELYELGGLQLIRLMVGFTHAINELGATAIELSSIKEVTDQQIGVVVCFDENFRTKNYSNYSGSLTGNTDKDPHVYKKINNLKWMLPIDPKWITTSTAQSDFCSGISRFAGLAMFHIKSQALLQLFSNLFSTKEASNANLLFNTPNACLINLLAIAIAICLHTLPLAFNRSYRFLQGLLNLTAESAHIKSILRI